MQDIANRLGANWNYQHPSEIMEEIASLTPMFAGVNYERLEGYKSLQWPVAADGTDQPLALHRAFPISRTARRGSFPSPGPAPTRPADRGIRSASEQRPPARAFPRGQPDLPHAGAFSEKMPDTFVEVSPELADERGIQSGTWVQLRSRATARSRVRALVTDRVHGHELYMPDELHGEPVNRLTSSHTDPITHTPAYKETSVNMKVLPEGR